MTRSAAAEEPRTTGGGVTADPERPAPARSWWTVVVVTVATGALALIPALIAPYFYMRGDTAAQFAPTWFHLGEMVRSGQWPPLLDPGAWVGGNYAAEALFGVYNPLNVLIWVFVSLMPDLLVAVLVVKVVALVVLALGTLALAREYGARDPAAALVAVALPVSGYTLFWDAGSWVSGLIAFAYTPWVWWAFRRVARGRSNVLLGFVVGSLSVTQGNPYGTLAVVVTGVAVLLETLVTRRRGGVLRLLLVGVCVASWLPLVFWPLLETASVGARVTGALFANDGMMRPQLGDLLAQGAPTYVPGIRSVTGPTLAPVTYGAWFVLPLLPWVRWDLLRRGTGGLRPLTGLGLVALAYTLLAVGPSKLWFFRWPLRLVEYSYLALAVAFAVALSAGLHRDRRAVRSTATVVLVAATGWMSWSQDPTQLWRTAWGLLVLLVGTAALLVVLLVRRSARRAGPAQVSSGLRRVAIVGVAGTALVLGVQVHVFGENQGSRVWHFPHDVADVRARFGPDRGATLMQFADVRPLQRPGHDRELRAAWQDYLAGSMFHVAGVDAVNNYTGIGYAAFTRRLCMHYEGLTRRCGLQHVFEPSAPGEPVLADLMKLSRVVAQPSFAQGVRAPAGWQRQPSASGRPVVWTRRSPTPFPGSRLSDAGGTAVTSARSDGPYAERADVQVAGGAPARLTFAMLAWPGYRAELDGHGVAVRPDAAGLLTVELPAGSRGQLVVRYRPPGQTVGLLSAGLGTTLAVLAGVLTAIRGRRRPRRAARAS